MSGLRPQRQKKGAHHLTAERDTICVDANTYYKIEGSWGDGETNNGFEFDGSGAIRYIAPFEKTFMFAGSSDVASDKNCTITYGLYINGVLVPGAETPHTFNSANSVSTIAIALLINFKSGDEIEIWCKSTVANTTITSKTLSLAIMGDV